MLGEKLKELRESKGLLQRQVAAELDVDTLHQQDGKQRQAGE